MHDENESLSKASPPALGGVRAVCAVAATADRWPADASAGIDILSQSDAGDEEQNTEYNSACRQH